MICRRRSLSLRQSGSHFFFCTEFCIIKSLSDARTKILFLSAAVTCTMFHTISSPMIPTAYFANSPYSGIWSSIFSPMIPAKRPWWYRRFLKLGTFYKAPANRLFIRSNEACCRHNGHYGYLFCKTKWADSR